MKDKLAEEKITHVKPAMYSYFFYELRVIALRYGYNLVLHGSMNRDLDLIAIPWHEPIGDIDTMVQEMASYLRGSFVSMTKEEKECFPHGRLSYVINMNRGGAWNRGFDEQYYIDISVIPSPKLYHEARLKEIKDDDIEAWALEYLHAPHPDYVALHTVDVFKTALIIGAKAFRDGKIKHIK